MGGYNDYYTMDPLEAYDQQNDTPPQSTSDPYGAPTDGSDTANAFEDLPDTGGASMPGSSLVPFLPLASRAASALIPAQYFSAGGPNGVRMGAGVDNLGVTPVVRARSQGGGGARSQLLAAASMASGVRLTAPALIALVRKWGIPAVMAFTKLTAEALLYLWATKSKRGKRGPFLKTVVKRIRRADGYRNMLAKYARKAGIGRGRAHSNQPKQFRRKRRK